MHLSNLTNHLEAVAGVKRFFVFLLVLSLVANVIQAWSIASFDKTVRDIFIPPEIKKSFWVDGRTLGADYLEQMGYWIVQQYASTTPTSVAYQNSLLLKYVHPAVYGPLSVRFEAGANKIKRENLSTHFMPREVRISEKGQAVAFIGTQTTWIADKRAPNQIKAYIVVFDYDGSSTYVKEVRETDPNRPLSEADSISREVEDENQQRGTLRESEQPESTEEATGYSMPPAPAPMLAPAQALPEDLPPPPQETRQPIDESLQLGFIPPTQPEQ